VKTEKHGDVKRPYQGRGCGLEGELHLEVDFAIGGGG
jgi:hypothetical protein